MPQTVWQLQSNDIAGQRPRYEPVGVNSFFGTSKSDSSGSDTLFQTGLELLRAKQYLSAIRAFQQAIIIAPHFVQYYVNLGEAFEGLGFWHEARVAYETAFMLNRSDLKVRLKIACVLEQLGIFDVAAEIYRHFAAAHPDSAVFQRKFQQIGSLAAQQFRPVMAPNDYNAIHADRANICCDVRGKRCLVIGCAQGKDCTYFINYGASCVHGVDVMDEIGKDFQHSRVSYFKCSAEQMTPIPSDSYDLVYCFATMEHVPRVDLAFAEMVRAARPGGIIYCVAAPLWNCCNGHHYSDIFGDYPWIHLRLDAGQLLDFCTAHNIKGRDNGEVYPHIKYIYDKNNFNMTAAGKYVETCANLPNIGIIKNDLTIDDDKKLTPEIYNELNLKGYTRQELLASLHTFIARKLPEA